MRLRRFVPLSLLLAVGMVLAACGEPAERGTDGKAASKPAASAGAGTLAAVRKAGVLTVGTEGTYRPFSFHENGTGPLTGFDVEIARAVGEKLGVKVDFVETQWDAIFAGLDSARFDVIGNQVSINPEREARYAFSTPYTVSPGVVVTKKDDDSISSFADLKGKTTAQSLTSNWYELAKNAGAKVEPIEGWAQAVALLKQGRVDATVNDNLTFLDWQKTEKDDSLKIAATTDDVSHNAFAFRKGSDDLVAAVDKALADLAADGTLAQISQKYFGADVTK
ncbi:cystine transport system substrate-binding protein [Nocardioides terrae]|uniref:Cystine transport system substrate-binding protein n=1 Tax=Nocardioides terrae TaxID=574651 RepID=A0A1I1MR35_9ACTN|nr:amino acid ABC transporter substrate-binding protein [Nocardioides terrae]SFC87322.1 cystine transport system substrate-binding protein [Nocardioides terrae]